MKKKRNVYPVEQIRQWIADGKTQAWIGNELGFDSRLIAKVCKKHCIKCQRTGPRAGSGHPDWKGGRLIDKDGYVLLYSPGHPFARKPRMKYVPEHRLVMEKHLKRYLTRSEVVHHKDKNKQNNEITNLELFSKNADHLKHELTGKIPKWTEDGEARIRHSLQKLADNRRGLTPDEYRNKRNSLRNST